MSRIPPWTLAVLATIALPGCAVGYNSTLFYTQSNIGLDAETKPPTAEISIARREGVIEPGFEGGQTPTVVASFRSNADPLSRFFFGVQSTFAGGDAAAALAAGQGGPEFTGSSAICLSQKPRPKLFGLATIPEKGDVMPFAFGTDTVFGLKVSWSGTTAQFSGQPSSRFQSQGACIRAAFRNRRHSELHDSRKQADRHLHGPNAGIPRGYRCPRRKR